MAGLNRGGGDGGPSTKKRRITLEADGLESKLECPVCLQVPRCNIMQCVAGHKVCERCFDSLTPKTCPTARCEYNDPPTRDRILEELILACDLNFPCSNETYGCASKMKQALLSEHEAACDFRLVACPFIGFDDCPDRTVPLVNMIGHGKQKHKDKCVWKTMQEMRPRFKIKIADLARCSSRTSDRKWEKWVCVTNKTMFYDERELLFVFHMVQSSHTIHFWVSMNKGSKDAAKFEYEVDVLNYRGSEVVDTIASFKSNPIVPAEEHDIEAELWKTRKCPSLGGDFVKWCLKKLDDDTDYGFFSLHVRIISKDDSRGPNRPTSSSDNDDEEEDEDEDEEHDDDEDDEDEEEEELTRGSRNKNKTSRNMVNFRKRSRK